MDWLEDLATALVRMSGNGFDPESCPLPAFPQPPAENRARIPDAPKKVRETQNPDLLTEEEMMDKRSRYWRGERQAAKDVEELRRDNEAKRKAVVVDFDETPIETDLRGLTEREYGEMLAYSPPLTNIALAVKVKERKAKYTLKEIAEQTGETEQMIRHYSSALHKASLSPASIPRKSRLSSKRSKK